MPTAKPCSICKASACPCPVCHGNPKKYLGGIHSGIPDHKTGAVKCKNCGKSSSRA